MSGGSMNYLYSRLENNALFDQDTPERRAFAAHLDLVVRALHDIEWVDSGDYDPGGDAEAIRACLGNSAAAAIEQRDAEIARLREALRNVRGWQESYPHATSGLSTLIDAALAHREPT